MLLKASVLSAVLGLGLSASAAVAQEAEPVEEAVGAGEAEAVEEGAPTEGQAAEAEESEEEAGDEAHAAEEGEDEAAEHEGHVTDFQFSFEGPFGAFDQAQLQRGLQVYTEVCAACHGLQYVPYRSLSEPGGPSLADEQMRAYAAQFQVEDPVTGEMAPAAPTDYFAGSQLEAAPDLSLMAKARAGFHGPYGTGLNQLFRGMGGAEYIASFLLGYTGEQIEQAGVVLYENTAFGGYVQMPPILQDGLVTYADGVEASQEQMALDVAAFLMWTAEPKMMARKQAGLTAVLFLLLLTVLLYFTNKKLWSKVKGKGEKAL